MRKPDRCMPKATIGPTPECRRGHPGRHRHMVQIAAAYAAEYTTSCPTSAQYPAPAHASARAATTPAASAAASITDKATNRICLVMTAASCSVTPSMNGTQASAAVTATRRASR